MKNIIKLLLTTSLVIFALIFINRQCKKDGLIGFIYSTIAVVIVGAGYYSLIWSSDDNQKDKYKNIVKSKISEDLIEDSNTQVDDANRLDSETFLNKYYNFNTELQKITDDSLNLITFSRYSKISNNITVPLNRLLLEKTFKFYKFNSQPENNSIISNYVFLVDDLYVYLKFLNEEAIKCKVIDNKLQAVDHFEFFINGNEKNTKIKFSFLDKSDLVNLIYAK